MKYMELIKTIFENEGVESKDSGIEVSGIFEWHDVWARHKDITLMVTSKAAILHNGNKEITARGGSINEVLQSIIDQQKAAMA